MDVELGVKVEIGNITNTVEAVGQWKPVGLGSALPESELEKGTILPFGEADGGTSLYVFSRRGEAIRAPVMGCVP